MTCENCIHNDLCNERERSNGKFPVRPCHHYKDKSLCVGLPCKTGSKVWFIAKKENDKQFSVFEGQVGCFRIENYYSRLAVIHWTDYQETYRYIARFEDFGKTVFLTKEDAEIKLQEMG